MLDKTGICVLVHSENAVKHIFLFCLAVVAHGRLLRGLLVVVSNCCRRDNRVCTVLQDRNMCFTAFRVDHSTVQTIFSRLQQLYITKDRPCSRRPRVTTAR
jgi:hypothetical protein